MSEIKYNKYKKMLFYHVPSLMKCIKHCKTQYFLYFLSKKTSPPTPALYIYIYIYMYMYIYLYINIAMTADGVEPREKGRYSHVASFSCVNGVCIGMCILKATGTADV